LVNRSNKDLREKGATANLNFEVPKICLGSYLSFQRQEKDGGRIKKLFVGLLLCVITALLTSTTCVKAQQLPKIQSIEDMEVDITLELLPDARAHITVDIEAQLKMEELPITGGSLGLRVSSPSSEQLKFNVTGSLTLTQAGLDGLPEETRTMLTAINAGLINDFIAHSEIEGKSLSEVLSGILEAEGAELPPEAADIKIEEIKCTEFSWKEPTIEAGLTTTLSGSAFEKKVDLSLDIDITVEGNTATVKLICDGYFDLPRVENDVRWSFEMPGIGTIPSLENFAPENLGELLGQYDAAFTLKVPEDASVSGLPLGYSSPDDTTYTWSGGDAGTALGTVLTKGAQPEITYGYKAPPSWLPWAVVGALVVAIVSIAAVVVLRRR